MIGGTKMVYKTTLVPCCDVEYTHFSVFVTYNIVFWGINCWEKSNLVTPFDI